MKIKTSRKRANKWRGKKLPSGCAVLHLPGCPSGVLYDVVFRSKVLDIPWRYDPIRNRVRGFFGKGKTRQYMHRYLLSLTNRIYPDVKFLNGDNLDMRMDNLAPYDRSEDGARRRPFKNRTKKGISWNKRTQKWVAMIRVRGKLKHLGYFSKNDVQLAVAAYTKAWKIAHPNSNL